MSFDSIAISRDVVSTGATIPLMPFWLRLALLPIVAAAAILAIDQLFLWAESRGWIYWRKRKREPSTRGGGVAAGLSVFQSLVEPQVRHVIIERDQRRMADTAEQGAPPGISDGGPDRGSPGPKTPPTPL